MSEQNSEPTLERSGWRLLQLRSLLAANLAVVAVGLVLLAFAGGLFTYNTHLDPGTEVETVQDSRWSSTGEYAHEATVRNGTAVFDRGAVLRDRPTYLETVAPILDGTFVYEYTASGGGDLRTDIEVALVLRSVSEDGFEFWREERTLAARTADSLQSGEQMTVPFSMNVTALRERIATIENQLGTTPGTAEITVQSRVQIEGQRNGEVVEQRRNYTMNVLPGDGVYSVENDGPTERGNEQFRRETATASYGPLRSTIPPAVLVGAVLAAAGIGIARFRDRLALSSSEQAWLSYCQNRSEFDEWLSTGDLSSASLPDRRVEISTLGDLVDLAIDSNRRVIEGGTTYAVLVEDVAYVYERPTPPGETPDPLSESGDETTDSDETRGSAAASTDGAGAPKENGE